MKNDNVYNVIFLLSLALCSQLALAAFSGRELLAGNHTEMKKNFTGLDYLNIRLDTSSPINTFDNSASSASSESSRDRLWKKHRKDRNAKPLDTVSGTSPNKDSGILQGFDGNSQQLVPPEINQVDVEALGKKKDLLLELLKETEDQLAKKGGQ